MKRTLNSTFLNEVVNHPEVHKWLGVKEAVDLTGVVSNPDNYAFVNEGGGFIGVQLTPGVYEVHTQFLPEGRMNISSFMQECLSYIFIKTNCTELLTQLPDHNKAAKKLAERAGFNFVFRRENTPRGPTEYHRLTLEEWVQNTETLEDTGFDFHKQLHEAVGGENHPLDLTHDSAVGAAVQMIKAGNAFKAVDYYNKWAKFTGYLPITLLNDTPPVVDVIDAVVGWNGKQMEILSCR